MNASKAFSIGVLGALVMSAIMALARTLGMEANLEMMLGTITGRDPGPVTWLIGFLIHLLAGGGFALIYAALFEYVTHRAGWGIGAAFGLLHAMISGLMLGVIPAIHPMIPEQMPAPGMFMWTVQMGVLAFLFLHFVYGAIVGGLYKPVIHARTPHPHPV